MGECLCMKEELNGLNNRRRKFKHPVISLDFYETLLVFFLDSPLSLVFVSLLFNSSSFFLFLTFSCTLFLNPLPPHHTLSTTLPSRPSFFMTPQRARRSRKSTHTPIHKDISHSEGMENAIRLLFSPPSAVVLQSLQLCGQLTRAAHNTCSRGRHTAACSRCTRGIGDSA